jgi:hypothetical protein
MHPNERRLAASQAVDRALHRLLAGAALSDADVTMVVAALFAGRWVGFDLFSTIQRQFRRLSPQGASARESIRFFLSKDYHHCLRSFEARRAALAPGLVYKVDHIPKTTPNNRRPGQKMLAQYLTIHSTGNPSSASGGERNWLTSAENHRTASFHVVIDAKQAIECIPFDEVAWHAGDAMATATSEASASRYANPVTARSRFATPSR